MNSSPSSQFILLLLCISSLMSIVGFSQVGAASLPFDPATSLQLVTCTVGKDQCATKCERRCSAGPGVSHGGNCLSDCVECCVQCVCVPPGRVNENKECCPCYKSGTYGRPRVCP